jgi:hypothetical protein
MLKTEVKRAKPFITLKISDDVIKFISVREISKIIVNKSRKELIFLLVSGDKDVVKFRRVEDLEDAYAKIYTVYSNVFVG